jgi:hypothetical protein
MKLSEAVEAAMIADNQMTTQFLTLKHRFEQSVESCEVPDDHGCLNGEQKIDKVLGDFQQLHAVEPAA